MRRCWVDSNFFVVYFFCLSSFVSSVNCVGVNVKGWFLLERLAAKRYLHTKCGRERERPARSECICACNIHEYIAPRNNNNMGVNKFVCVCESLAVYIPSVYIF
jgi:hypothetical protein